MSAPDPDIDPNTGEARRQAVRVSDVASLAGDPTAVARLRRGWQPWLDMRDDLARQEPDDDDGVVGNL